MDDKKRKALSDIQRALGIIEGIATGVEIRQADNLEYAVGTIDEALKELMDLEGEE